MNEETKAALDEVVKVFDAVSEDEKNSIAAVSGVLVDALVKLSEANAKAADAGAQA